MLDCVITTKRGSFGRVQITLPISVKQSMLTWVKKSGMGKTEFLRVALMMGAAKLADQVAAKNPSEGYLTGESQNFYEEEEGV
jgi:hypothetical protein